MKFGDGSILTEDRPKGKKNNLGTSMITVIVSFALLLVFVTVFYQVQRASGNIMMSAKDMLINNRELSKAYYLDETENQVIAADTKLTFRGEAGNFCLEATLKKASKEGLKGSIYYYDKETGQEQVIQ